MGLIKKVFKGIKKVAKKIGKGIKSVINKVGKAFGKLGIVGQLGMMFLMPYAMSGLSSFFGQFALKGGTTWASQLAGSSNVFSQAVGKAMGAIHSAGSVIGNVYNTVTQAISNGFDRATNFIKGEGFTLSEGRTSIFAPKADAVADVVPPKPEVTKDVLEDVVDDRSLLEKGKDYVGQTIESFKKDITDPQKMGEKASGAITKGVSTRLAYSVAGEPPVQQYVNISPFDIGTIETFNSKGVFNEVDFNNMNMAYQSQGSAWGATNSLAHPHLMDTISGGSQQYLQAMNQLRGYGI
jgi:hypothetical protein